MKNYLTYKGRQFYLNERPFRIISGTVHYFRVVPDYWEDRLRKLKACGFNCVETYTCWNLHEPEEGKFDFEGILDLARYLRTAQRLGLYVILRPGPYICAEWDFGGLPSWLLNVDNIHLRCCDDKFLSKVRAYYHKLFQVIRPYMGSEGGNIIAMQVENEYGSYGDDHEYMRAVMDIYREEKIDCLYFTSDGPTRFMLNGGSLPGCLAALNFGSRPADNFRLLEEFRPEQPFFCCEFWNGWFDHWYEEHHVTPAEDTAVILEEMLKLGASVNLYMFHGGTNFGFNNGANFDNVYQPTVTSYDYNCPLNENGDMTPKYHAIKEVIKKYEPDNFKDAPEAENQPRKAYGRIRLTEYASMFEELPRLSSRVSSAFTRTMEELGQDFGFLLYSTVLSGPFEEQELVIDGLHDRALIYLDGKPAGVKERTGKRNDIIRIGLAAGEQMRLDILTENMGRINYGTKILDRKGILRGVMIGRQLHFGWDMYPVRCENPDSLTYLPVSEMTEVHNGHAAVPAFFRGELIADEVKDTFIRLDGFEKGNVFINGFNIGRYWNSAGPQKTLYVPAPLLKKGRNKIIVFELEKMEKPEVMFADSPELG